MMALYHSPLQVVIIGADPYIPKGNENAALNKNTKKCTYKNQKKTPNGMQIGPIRIPVANSYDVDNEYSYIMNKALRSYKLHRDKERAENRQKVLKTAYRRRWHVPQRPNTPSGNSRKSRPKSTLPPKMDAIKEVGEANNASEAIPGDSPDNRKPVDVKKVTISMDNPAMSSSYHRRNQETSHAWYSHSCPSASYLNNYMRSQHSGASSSSPSPSSSSTSGRSIPIPITSAKRPYSARVEGSKKRPDSGDKYSYDGGIFLPNKPKSDYFVIHPDWVSEAMTIQKLSLNERRPTSAKSDTWPIRRCKSAPPPKFRNPITWDVRMDNV